MSSTRRRRRGVRLSAKTTIAAKKILTTGITIAKSSSKARGWASPKSKSKAKNSNRSITDGWKKTKSGTATSPRLLPARLVPCKMPTIRAKLPLLKDAILGRSDASRKARGSSATSTRTTTITSKTKTKTTKMTTTTTGTRTTTRLVTTTTSGTRTKLKTKTKSMTASLGRRKTCLTAPTTKTRSCDESKMLSSTPADALVKASAKIKKRKRRRRSRSRSGSYPFSPLPETPIESIPECEMPTPMPTPKGRGLAHAPPKLEDFSAVSRSESMSSIASLSSTRSGCREIVGRRRGRRQRQPKPRLIIFDWDDTLLPTSSLLLGRYQLGLDLSKIPSEAQAQLLVLESLAIELLNICLRYDGDDCEHRVFIVTNAVDSWVVNSAQRYMPRLYHFLVAHDATIGTPDDAAAVACGWKAGTQLRGDASTPPVFLGARMPVDTVTRVRSIRVVSASHLYSRKAPSCRNVWKLCTFSDICDAMLLKSQPHNGGGGSGTHAREVSMSASSSRFDQSSPRSTSTCSAFSATFCGADDAGYCGDVVLPCTPTLGGVHSDCYEFDDLNLMEPSESISGNQERVLPQRTAATYDWDLVSIGDACHESNAALLVGGIINENQAHYKSLCTKVVKLRRHPTMRHMIDQMLALKAFVPKLFDSGEHMFVDDICTQMRYY